MVGYAAASPPKASSLSASDPSGFHRECQRAAGAEVELSLVGHIKRVRLDLTRQLVPLTSDHPFPPEAPQVVEVEHDLCLHNPL